MVNTFNSRSLILLYARQHYSKTLDFFGPKNENKQNKTWWAKYNLEKNQLNNSMPLVLLIVRA